MAQFDVYRNAGRNSGVIPYVVTIQAAVFDDYRRRVVVPLVDRTYLDATLYTRFNPTFDIEEISVVLNPLEIVSVDVSKLGEFVLSLADAGQLILDAIDELIARAHG